MPEMTIGRAAEAAGVNVETIRFYERRGLIDQPPKPQSGGFRIYGPETIQRIRFIREAQELGFSLREAAELLSLRADASANARTVRARVQHKLADVEARIGRLQIIRTALNDLLAACPGRGPARRCTILESLERAEHAHGTGRTKGGSRR